MMVIRSIEKYVMGGVRVCVVAGFVGIVGLVGLVGLVGCESGQKGGKSGQVTEVDAGVMKFETALKEVIANALVAYRLSGNRVPADAGEAGYTQSVVDSLSSQYPDLMQLSAKQKKAFKVGEFNRDADWAAMGRLVTGWDDYKDEVGIVEQYLLDGYREGMLSLKEMAVGVQYLSVRLKALQ